MTKYVERFERVFQCSRCRVKFTRDVSQEESQKITCPRSCPESVADITDEEKKRYEQRRRDRLKRVATREASEQKNKKE